MTATSQNTTCRVPDHQAAPSDPSKYRSDIDGLRAIAVLAVIGFHYLPAQFRGGFIGVDVFFVISGYLISGIVITEVERGSFSFASFYARRARRILPALACVSLITIAILPKYFFASQILGAYQSLLASFLFVGNIYFYITTDYFGVGANEIPYLHYWSLGVEEQFYLFFPLLVFLLTRLPGRIKIICYSVVATLSLIGCEIVLNTNPLAAYYLIPWRAWEILTGTLTFLASRHVWSAARWSTIAFLVGMAAIIQAIFMLNSASRFPGLSALPACIGASLVILSGSQRRLLGNRILGSQPLRYLGQISYSLYLIHWPVYVILSSVSFANHFGTKALSRFLISFVLAALTYQFIEKRARTLSKYSSSLTLRFSAAIVGLVMLLGIAGSVFYGNKLAIARQFWKTHPIELSNGPVNGDSSK